MISDKKSVLAGASDDDGEPNTYDRDDSFIAESASLEQTQEASGEEEESEDEKEQIQQMKKEAKDFMKNKKLVQPAK